MTQLDNRSPSDIDRTIGARVRERRNEIGMSQETLADELGITFQQVQKYEKGANRIAASRLVDIGHVLRKPASAFLRGLARKRPA